VTHSSAIIKPFLHKNEENITGFDIDALNTAYSACFAMFLQNLHNIEIIKYL